MGFSFKKLLKVAKPRSDESLEKELYYFEHKDEIKREQQAKLMDMYNKDLCEELLKTAYSELKDTNYEFTFLYDRSFLEKYNMFRTHLGTHLSYEPAQISDFLKCFCGVFKERPNLEHYDDCIFPESLGLRFSMSKVLISRNVSFKDFCSIVNGITECYRFVYPVTVKYYKQSRQLLTSNTGLLVDVDLSKYFNI